MRSGLLALLAVAACSFSVGASGDCEETGPGWWDPAWTARFEIVTGNVPSGYTLRVDARAAIALSRAAGADVRVVMHADAGAQELDRLLEGDDVVLRVPQVGTLWLYTANASASQPPADPSRVYAVAESFEAMAVGSDGSPRFETRPGGAWSVVDDGGNLVYRATIGNRYSAAISGLAMAEGELAVRARINAGGTQNHIGLIGRASTLDVPVLDGFVGQLLGDSARSRVAEYTDGISPPAELGSTNRTVTPGVWYELRLRLSGNTVELYVDGTLEASGPSTASNGVMAGLFAHAGDVDFDDVRARKVVNPEPVTSLRAVEHCGR